MARSIHEASHVAQEALLRAHFAIPATYRPGEGVHKFEWPQDGDTTALGTLACGCAGCSQSHEQARKAALNSIMAVKAVPVFSVALTKVTDTHGSQHVAYQQIVDLFHGREFTALPEQLQLAEPTDHVNAEEKRLAGFAERGIVPIPDDECTDMGEYVIWNKYTPDQTVDTRPPSQYTRLETLKQRSAYYSSTWKDPRIDTPVRMHLTKPVRVQCTFMSGYTAYKYSIVNGAQCARVYDMNGYTDGLSAIHLEGAPDFVLCSVGKWSRNQRKAYLKQLVNDLRRRGVITEQRKNQVGQLFGPKSDPHAVYRGEIVGAVQYKAAKKVCQQAGVSIANLCDPAFDEDAGDFCGFLTGVTDNYTLHYAHKEKFLEKFLDLWNEASAVEIQKLDCGHFAIEGEGHEVRSSGDHITVCGRCLDDDYVMPEDSGYYHHTDDCYCDEDGDYRLEDPRQRSRNDSQSSVGGAIQGYTTNVLDQLDRDHTIVPSVFGDTLMGIELEVVPTEGNKVESVKHTIENLTNGYAIMKRDGSIGERGYEIVTAPRGLKEHLERFSKWTPHPALRSWDTGKCGMHVHLSSQAFSQATFGKFLEFINSKDNDKLMIAIAGRHPSTDSNAETYCKREGQVSAGNPKKTLFQKGADRYHMVNAANLSREEADRLGLKGREREVDYWSGEADDYRTRVEYRPFQVNGKDYDTIELRIFRGTLNKNRLLAQIEFAHAALMFCRVSSMRELKTEDFLAWLQQNAPMYKNLAKWFGVRANSNEIAASPKAREAAEV